MKRLFIILALFIAIALLVVSEPGQNLIGKLTQEFTKRFIYKVEEIDYPKVQQNDNNGGNGLNTPDEGSEPKSVAETEEDLVIPVINSSSDKDDDGVCDSAAIVAGARLDAMNKPRYKDAYYSGGYPPDNEGVCTDVVWRALKNAGYNLKDLIDEDIGDHTDLYPRVDGKPDPNIDFRRVQNLIAFFNRFAEVLTTDLTPGDSDNLVQWQGGDIVVFLKPYEHVGILSVKRDKDGVPYLIHNGGPYTKEENILSWYLSQGNEVAWHFRFPKEE